MQRTLDLWFSDMTVEPRNTPFQNLSLNNNHNFEALGNKIRT